MASMGSDEDGDVQDYDETVDENLFLADVCQKYCSERAFLTREEKIFARSVRLDEPASDVWLHYQSDIDGCVVELSRITGVLLPIRHITLCPHEGGSLKNLKSVLKKHVDLKEFSKDALSNFNECVGIQLFYENGWECWLGLIPDTRTRTLPLNREIIRLQSLQTFQALRVKLRLKLLEYAAAGVAVQTIVKNDLNDLRKIFVLPGDRCHILEALADILASMYVKYFRPIVFCFRYGEKMKNGISLADFEIDSMKRVTVHAAVDISSSTPGIELLWSMEGVQQLVGKRGTLSTCLSLTDCGLGLGVRVRVRVWG